MRLFVRCASAVLLVFVLTLTPSLTRAQGASSGIVGTVVDATGQPLAAATIHFVDVAQHRTRMARSDAGGIFRVTQLDPGLYTVSASAEGFETASAEVALSVNETRRVQFRLAVAGFTQVVEVRARVDPLQSDSAAVGVVVDRERIGDLPLDRRAFLQLALLAPGVVPPVEDSELSSRGAFAMHANGAREEANTFRLDGVDNNDPYVNRYGVQPPLDSVQEFQVVTNSYSAEFGRTAGAQISVITRRGGQQFEGLLSAHLRNQRLDARNTFDGPALPRFSRAQLGGGLGGPLWRDRTFFFGAVDRLHERRVASRLGTVPTEDMRAGNLAALSKPVVDPFTGQPFPGNVIPASRIHPAARRIVDGLPLPNQPGTSANYLGEPVLREDHLQGSVRIDHVVSSRDQVTVRYSEGQIRLFEPYADEAGALPGYGDDVNDRPRNIGARYQRLLGAHAVNVLQVGHNRFPRTILPENHATDVATLWGVDWLDVGQASWGYPTLNVAGLSRIGDVTSLPIRRRSETWHAADSVSATWGPHLVKIGAEYWRLGLDGTLDMLSRGSLSFSGAMTGSGIGDLLLGLPSFALRSRADNPQHLRSHAIGLFAQDEWAVSSAFTLNAGLRYDYAAPPVDPANHMATLDEASGRVVRVGSGPVTRSGVRADRNNVGPRLGMAWRPRPSLVLRGGYGLSYDTPMLEVFTAQYFNPPYFTLRMYFPRPTALLTLSDPFPSVGGLQPPSSLSVVSPDFVSGVLQHFNGSAQVDLGRVGIATVTYAGSRGSHLPRARDLNQPRPGAGDVQSRRPNPSYGGIFFVESEGRSRYDSLQVAWSQRRADSWSLWLAYTLASSHDDASAFLSTKADRNFPQDSTNLGAEWGPSAFDVRHRLVVAGTLSATRGPHWLRGTEIRALATANSGYPGTPVLRFDNSNTGNGGQTTGWDRPDLVGNPALSDASAARWFNTGAFAVPSRYRFGSAGRNVVRGPGYLSVDVSVARRGRIGGVTATIEAQAFNLLNRANYNLPELFADEPTTFGRILSAKAPRQLQCAIRFQF